MVVLLRLTSPSSLFRKPPDVNQHTDLIRRCSLAPTLAVLALVAVSCGNGPTVETLVTPLDTGVASSAAASPTTAPSSTDALAPGETRLTTAQAARFSRVLVKDHQDGGAVFVATIPYGPAATFVLTGEIDWTKWDASAVLQTKRSDGKAQPDQAMFWSHGQLLQPIDGLTAALAAKGRPGVTHIVRPLDPKTAPIDRVIVLINSMSNTRAENPILLRQRTDVAFVGTAKFNDVQHDKYRYGSTTYWVDPAGGLGRIDAVFRTFAAPVQVVFSAKGPRTIALPASTAVVAASDIPDVMAALTGPGVTTSVG
jgi:hypothetical protein